jgi:hypothetical protein
MGRKTWFALALVVVVAASFAAGSAVAAPRAASDSRSRKVTRGLDYLHSQQTSGGGIGGMANTAWSIMGAVASGERVGSSAWTVKGNNPFEYLQANSHEAGAFASTNAPEYYARAIMAYVAAGQAVRVFAAGTTHIDLLTKLYSYQNTSGSFSPSSSSSTFQDVHTTAWAILALNAIGERGKTKFTLATTWLAGRQRGDGGFPAQSTSGGSNVVDTALAIQALKLDSSVLSTVFTNAKNYLKTHQLSGGGFSPSSGGIDAQATAAAIQAIVALGETQSSWAKPGGKTPALALGKLQRKSGAYNKRTNTLSAPLATTSWALMALRNQSFTTFPAARPAALKAFVFRPAIKTISPKNHTKYTSTHVVLIRATYTDGSGGTGVNAGASRLYVDSVNKSKPAVIGAYGLHLLLKNVANGQHTYTLHIVDNAGNVKIVERSFTVAVAGPPAATTPTTPTTSEPYVPTITPTYRPSTVTPTPSATLYPTPSATPSYAPSTSASAAPVTGSAVASPSPSASPGAAGAGASGGGGSAAGFLGGTLLAMLPIGAAISYLIFQRRAQALGAASEGRILSGGGSAWERAKRALSNSKNLVKPAGS